MQNQNRRDRQNQHSSDPEFHALAGDEPQTGVGLTRREFVGAAAAAVSVAVAGEPLLAPPASGARSGAVSQVHGPGKVRLALRVNGRKRVLRVDPRTTLLDALRERLGLTGTKKGCNHGQCGACTLLVDGRRINSCLALAVVYDGSEITTVEGLAEGDELHPLQAAFVRHDGFQCGYCTSGQICSAVGMLREVEQGTVSHVTPDVRQPGRVELTDEEIRERMSGNICRCGAYPGIVAAVREASGRGQRGG